jgi:DNA-binding CsgD family transcriptional regulator
VYAQLSAADQEGRLDPEEVERMAVAAHLLGRDSDSAELWARAHQEFLARGDARRAARCASWLAVRLLLAGEMARGGGWIGRGRRLLESEPDCVEQGYLLLPVGLQFVFGGDSASAYSTFADAGRLAERHADRNLAALARQGQGRALIQLGDTARGVALLDEVMVAVTAGELSPLVVGDIYCSVIEACHEIFDLRRAQEWTSALSVWCESQDDLVPYRGLCLVRRAEIMQLHGAWPDAIEEAERACEWLSRPPAQRALGAAFYRVGELHRLRGEFAGAEEAYRQASHWGREPQPGLAQLRLARGQVEAARTAICRALDETSERRTRSRLLGAYVEIMLAVGDVAAARNAADELARIATELDAPLLHAVSNQATGSVLRAEGDPRSALTAFRRAWKGWRELEAPYDAARVRVLVGLACRDLGDTDTAEMELDAARHAFEDLGAAPDVALVRDLARTIAPTAAEHLTARERQVLCLVATGKTNRAIAETLAISEKTVARHVSNIFTKLGISSRAAATAYAFQNRLV